jgi:hypothetical protein
MRSMTWGWAAALCVLLGCSDDATGPTTTGGGGAGGVYQQTFFECLPFDEVDPPPENDTVDIELVLKDTEGVALEDFKVDACDRADRDCANPVAGGTSVTDGLLAFELPVGMTGFSGFYEVKDKPEWPNLIFHSGITKSSLPNAFWQLSRWNQIEQMADSVGVDLDQTKGHVVFAVSNCLAQWTAGVSVTASNADNESKTVYLLEGNIPSIDIDRTTETGLGGIFNLPAGETVTMTATVAETGVKLQQRSQIYLRAGYFTHVNFRPYADSL